MGLSIEQSQLQSQPLLLRRYPEQELGHMQFPTCTRARRLFNRTGFIRRTATTGNVEIAEGVRKEAELTSLSEIVNKVQEFQIPPLFMHNLDQTKSKYVSIDKTKIAKKCST